MGGPFIDSRALTVQDTDGPMDRGQRSEITEWGWAGSWVIQGSLTCSLGFAGPVQCVGILHVPQISASSLGDPVAAASLFSALGPVLGSDACVPCSCPHSHSGPASQNGCQLSPGCFHGAWPRYITDGSTVGGHRAEQGQLEGTWKFWPLLSQVDLGAIPPHSWGKHSKSMGHCSPHP